MLILIFRFHCQKGNYGESVPFFRKAEQLCQNNGMETSGVLADSHFGLSSASIWLKDYDRARFYCAENLSYRVMIPSEPISLAVAYSEFAVYYLAVGKYEQAAQSALKAIEAYDLIEEYRSKTKIAIFPAVYAAFANINLGRLESAEGLLAPCLEWQERNLGRMNTISFR